MKKVILISIYLFIILMIGISLIGCSGDKKDDPPCPKLIEGDGVWLRTASNYTDTVSVCSSNYSWTETLSGASNGTFTATIINYDLNLKHVKFLVTSANGYYTGSIGSIIYITYTLYNTNPQTMKFDFSTTTYPATGTYWGPYTLISSGSSSSSSSSSGSSSSSSSSGGSSCSSYSSCCDSIGRCCTYCNEVGHGCFYTPLTCW